MTSDSARTLRQQLFDQTDRQAYAILDGASIPNLRQRLWQHQPPHHCLLRGELDDEMAQVAPYLVQLDEDAEFTRFAFEGWGQHWGIFLLSRAGLRDMRRHFRMLVRVHHPETGQPMHFRFYDPRVLRVFLPTCDADQLRELYGPASRFLMEDEDPQHLLIFRQSEGRSECERLALN